MPKPKTPRDSDNVISSVIIARLLSSKFFTFVVIFTFYEVKWPLCLMLSEHSHTYFIISLQAHYTSRTKCTEFTSGIFGRLTPRRWLVNRWSTTGASHFSSAPFLFVCLFVCGSGNNVKTLSKDQCFQLHVTGENTSCPFANCSVCEAWFTAVWRQVPLDGRASLISCYISLSMACAWVGLYTWWQ